MLCFISRTLSRHFFKTLKNASMQRTARAPGWGGLGSPVQKTEIRRRNGFCIG